MSATRDYRPVRPELVAAKVERVRNFELPELLEEMVAEPRLSEVLWFLAYVSRAEHYPGGLQKFARDLIADSADMIGTATMQEAVEPFTEEAAYRIHEELPGEARDYLGVNLSEVEVWSLNEPGEEAWERVQGRERERREASKRKLCAMRRTDFAAICAKAADEHLAEYLFNLCERLDVRFRRVGEGFMEGGRAPWYFVRIADAILRFIDRRKARLAAEIAETGVTREVFKWLGKALATRRTVVIEGSSRRGKTEAVRTWCAMNAGRARLVETPPTGGESDLLRAVAKALGLEIDARRAGYELRAQIETVLQQSGICLVLDEAQFLYPSNFSRNTMPARLNWVRRTIMDAGLPCAFICTPQSHQDARRRYLKATGFAIEQLDGRILKTVRLPEEISAEDLLAIARIHLRGLPEPYLELVVEKTAKTERNYVSDVSNIAALAFSNAEDAGRSKPNLEDFKRAIEDVLPAVGSGTAAPAPQRAGRRSEMPMKTLCADAEKAAPGRTLAPSSRATADNDFEVPRRDESSVILAG